MVSNLMEIVKPLFVQGRSRVMNEWIGLQVFHQPKPQSACSARDGHRVSHKTKRRSSLKNDSFQIAYFISQRLKTVAGSWDKRFPGWRSGVAGFSILASVILLINITALIWAVNSLDEKPFATLAMSSCANITAWSTSVQLAITFLSAALLAGSNYCMQCLSSPTRREVDSAHAKGSYLNIGLLSWRNVRICRKLDMLLLVILTLSSLPLQLAYSSSVVIGGAVQVYDIALVTPDFMSGGSWTGWGETQSAPGVQSEDRIRALQNRAVDGQIENKDIWENISIAGCKDQYNFFQTDRGSVLVVAEEIQQHPSSPSNRLHADGSNTTSTVLWYRMIAPFDSEETSISWGQQSAHDWHVFDHNASPLLYCLSLKVPGRCRLQIHIWFLVVVIVLNFSKLGCMLYLFMKKSSTPLMTVGDAVASFLDSPYERSKGSSLRTERELKTIFCVKSDDLDDGGVLKAKRFSAKPLRYHHSISFLRWTIYSLFCILLMLGAAYYYNEILARYRGDRIYHPSLRTFWKMGFGNLYEMSNAYLVPPWCHHPLSRSPGDWMLYYECVYSSGPTFLMILGALPQPLISGLYVLINHHLTVMIQLRDWTRLASYRQPLRVSNPEPGSKQVSTYWLSLPYRYSIPQFISSTALGWLVSQAIFFYRIKWYDNDGSVFKLIDDDAEYKLSKQIWLLSMGRSYGVGFSAMGVICSLVLGVVVFLASMIISFRKCAPGLPLGPTNSLVIAAACHPPETDYDAARNLIQWGVIDTGDQVGRQPHHCTITSRRVNPPVEGRIYS
ncbi:hypothetical protein P154DRAFT_247680 [Amniculicola lignicola CBS 123094]|uniref:DUF6536 domain-containing protein n=1 Tax=Amniculicola lignicola CBS 123094 TaxID=1392246 RepID=A0A6A5WAP1_9PLEO|nr:hypothetical protein P154DRAFT_247680 [Amniculicola lignicola CBS 123094]